MRRILHRSAALAALPVLFVPALWSQEQRKMSNAEQEEFLKTAKIIKTVGAKKGTTGTSRITLSDGTFTHDAHLQSIDESKLEFKGENGTTEFNFRDTYKYNIVAYRLGTLLGIGDMIPVCVERKVNGKTSAVDWWVDDVQFDEETRLKQKVTPPDPELWNQYMYVVRVFDQLIYNTDRNLGHILTDKDWHPWMIDHSRAFRLQHTLRDPKNLTKVERNLLAKLKELNEETLVKELRPYATKEEIKAILARRDLIVKFFDSQIQSKGEADVVYTLAKK